MNRNLSAANKKIIIVAGYLAAGKSTFARLLSHETGVPYFIKDTFKSALCAGVEIDSRAESSRFSAVTFDAMMYIAERLMETGYPLILEVNFVPAGIKKTDEACVIKNLIGKYYYKPLTFKFTGDTNVLLTRFNEREKSPERGQANMLHGGISPEDFDKFCRNLNDFDVGGDQIIIDSTDFATVDYESHINTTRVFLNTVYE